MLLHIKESNEENLDNLFITSKQKILNLLQTRNNKSVKIFSYHRPMPWDDIMTVVDRLQEDEDILNAIISAGVTAKLKYATNRYAQSLPDVTFLITNTNPRNPGWSKWN